MTRVLLGAVAIGLGAFLVGCGGDDEAGDAGQLQATAVDRAYATRADAICARGLAETRRLGEEFSNSDTDAPDGLTLTTEGLIEPGIAIRARLAARLRALPQPRQGAAAAAAYLELFDPLETLSRERLRAGRAGDLDEAQRLERLMRDLADEQEKAARAAGLDTCSLDFVDAAFALGGSG